MRETVALLSAIHTAAHIYSLPVLLLKAFVAVGGADVNHPDGVMRLLAPTRGEIAPRMSRTYKLLALGLTDNLSLHEAALNDLFTTAYTNQNLLAQLLCGAHHIHEQLARFGNFVALAGLAYSAGSSAANRLVRRMGGDLRCAVALYHRSLGPAPSQASQSATPQIDSEIGAWLDTSVVANDTGQPIPNYGFLRQVPGQSPGLLDFVFSPHALAPLGLLEGEAAPTCAEENCVLVVESVYKSDTDHYNPEIPEISEQRPASILKGLP